MKASRPLPQSKVFVLTRATWETACWSTDLLAFEEREVDLAFHCDQQRQIEHALFAMFEGLQV